MAGEGKPQSSDERSVLRWGGIAGILSGIVFLLVPVVLFGFVPAAPADPAGLVARFPQVRTAIAVGNFLNFVSDAFLVALLLGLYRALRATSPSPAFFGTILGVLGLGVLFIESATQIAFDSIYVLYNAPGVTPADQSALARLFHATHEIYN